MGVNDKEVLNTFLSLQKVIDEITRALQVNASVLENLNNRLKTVERKVGVNE